MITLENSIQNEYSNITEDTDGFIYCINNDTPNVGPRIHRVLWTSDLSRTVGLLKNPSVRDQRRLRYPSGSSPWTSSEYEDVQIKAHPVDLHMFNGTWSIEDLRRHIIDNQVWCPQQAAEELEAASNAAPEGIDQLADLRGEIESLKAVIADLAKQVCLKRLQGTAI